MMSKLLGAVLILSGCGGFGMMICITYKREEEMLYQLIQALDFMQYELQFRMTPLPELCEQAGSRCKGKISSFFQLLSTELARQAAPDVSACIEAVTESMGKLPDRVAGALTILDVSLGQFDAQGQIHSLQAASAHCRTALEAMAENRESRLRSYQTLSICAGAALVILLV